MKGGGIRSEKITLLQLYNFLRFICKAKMPN